MKKIHFLVLTTCMMVLMCMHSLACYGVEVKILHDSSLGASDLAAIAAVERNLSAVLTEVNRAQAAHTSLTTKNFNMDEFSIKSIARIWAVTPFYCDDDVVVVKAWKFKDGGMLRGIPLIITPEDHSFGDGDYQEAVVEFDNAGKITDFRFALSAQFAEDMERCGSAIDEEKKQIILKYVENFRTAYNEKDINTIEQMFSDDALIITGHVVTVRKLEAGSISKKVEYNRQTKEQYISNLKKAFVRNKWIDVQFRNIADSNGSKTISDVGNCGGITRSKKDPTKYGIRLEQSWKSEHYSDEGYLFLLWEFPEDGRSPIIHVRTWQPEIIDGVKQKPNNDISTLEAFDL